MNKNTKFWFGLSFPVCLAVDWKGIYSFVGERLDRSSQMEQQLFVSSTEPWDMLV